METAKTEMLSGIAALFDLDGVILDTESQYTELWEGIGVDFLGRTGFGALIKGQTLVNIFESHFPDKDMHPQINKRLKDFEAAMTLPYVPGAKEFIISLREHGAKVAVVTSSDQEKMRNVYDKIPDFKSLFHRILTAEMFKQGKPEPDCYLLGSSVLGIPVEKCVVFEDSFHGLQAGRRAGMRVIGLATTNPREKIAGMADFIIEDFVDFSVEKLTDFLLATGGAAHEAT